MIGNSKLHEMVRRRRLLSYALIWYEAFDSDLKKQILNWIQRDQLTKFGIDADGDVIGYYSGVTASINPSKKFNTHFTLDDTGSFYQSMFVQVLSDRILIEAGSDTYRKMQKKDWFTDRILNLTDENLRKLKAEIKEKYIQAVRKILLGY